MICTVLTVNHLNDMFLNGGYCTKSRKRFFAKYFESIFFDSSSVASIKYSVADRLRAWSFWKGWNFWLFWISKHSNLWLLQIFLFKFQVWEMSVSPLKKSINIFKHDEKIIFLKIWFLDVSWNFKKIDFFSMFFP